MVIKRMIVHPYGNALFFEIIFEFYPDLCNFSIKSRLLAKGFFGIKKLFNGCEGLVQNHIIREVEFQRIPIG